MPRLGIKVFSATRARDRDQLGAVITAWLRANDNLVILDRAVLQSSDAEFHCLTIVLLYERP